MIPAQAILGNIVSILFHYANSLHVLFSCLQVVLPGMNMPEAEAGPRTTMPNRDQRGQQTMGPSRSAVTPTPPAPASRLLLGR